MWILHITDHSSEHTRRIWTTAGYAWVAKHLSWNVQARMKDWLLKFLTGESVFDDDQADPSRERGPTAAAAHADAGEAETAQHHDRDVKGKQRERWTAEPSTVDRAESVPSAESSATAAAAPKKLKEKPFTLDAWAFSYAS